MDRQVSGMVRIRRGLAGPLAVLLGIAAIAGLAVVGSPAAHASTLTISCTSGAAAQGIRVLTQQTLDFTMLPSPAACGTANLSAASVGSLSIGGTNVQPGYAFTPVGNGPVRFFSNVAGTAIVGFSNGPMVTITVVAPTSADVLTTLTYDPAGGSCSQATGLAYQGDWLALPTAASCSRAGYALSGWSTGTNGTGTVFTPGQTVHVLSNNTLYAVWASNTPASPAAAPGAPQSVTVRTRATLGTGTMSADVSWQAGTGTATQTVAKASTGQSCISTTTSCTIDGLRPDAAVTVSVVASNATGAGEPSASVAIPTITITARVATTGGRRTVTVVGSSTRLTPRASIDIWVRAAGATRFTVVATRTTDAQGQFSWRGSVASGASLVAMNRGRTVLSAPVTP